MCTHLRRKDRTPSFALPTVIPNATRGNLVGLSSILRSKHEIMLCFCPTTVAPKYAARTYSFQSGLTHLRSRGITILNISGSSLRGLHGFTRRSRLAFPLLSSPSLAIRGLCNTCNRGGLCNGIRMNIVHSALIVGSSNSITVTHCGIHTGKRISSLLGTLRGLRGLRG